MIGLNTVPYILGLILCVQGGAFLYFLSYVTVVYLCKA